MRTPSNIVAPVIADDAKTGTVVLRDVTVPLDTDVGQAFVIDCARNTEGLMPDHDLKTKYELSNEYWERLAGNTPLLHAVRAEREQRILSGEAAREAAQRHFIKAPHILGGILTDKLVSPRHQIEAAKELRQIAGNGQDAASRAGEKFTINIRIGDTTLRFEETIGQLETSPFDEGELS